MVPSAAAENEISFASFLRAIVLHVRLRSRSSSVLVLGANHPERDALARRRAGGRQDRERCGADECGGHDDCHGLLHNVHPPPSQSLKHPRPVKSWVLPEAATEA